MYMNIHPREMRARVDEIAEFTELGPYLDMPTRTYSSGMMIRLGFAVSTCIPPEILLMDEWLSAGDASFLEKAQRRMETLRRQLQHSGACVAFDGSAAQVVQSGYPASAWPDRGTRETSTTLSRPIQVRWRCAPRLWHSNKPRALRLRGPIVRRLGAPITASDDVTACTPTSSRSDEHGRGRSLQLQSCKILPDSLGHICSQTRPADQIW